MKGSPASRGRPDPFQSWYSRFVVKTILINVFDAAVAKNIFVPQFLQEIARAQDSVRIVVSVPQSKLDEYVRDYGHPALTFVARPQRYASRLESAALFIARNTIPTTSALRIQEKGLDGTGRLPPVRFAFARLMWLLGHIYLFRSLIKKVLAPVFAHSIFDDLIAQYRPDLIFATTIYAVDDVRLLRAAKRYGIPTLGMTKSWDNLTSKDAIFVPPDRLIVHNDVVKEEAITLHGYPADSISVVGVPQFDWYVDPEFPESKHELYARLKLDEGKKLVTYSAIGLWLVPHERENIAMMDRIVREKLDMPAQLLVRMPPAYPDEKAALEKMFPHVIIDEPGSPVRDTSNTWKADWKFTTDDVRELSATLKYSDVIVNCGSTMILDAACFDTPVIGLAFGGDLPETNWKFEKSIFARDHLHKVLKTGGLRLARSEQELVDALNAYLKDRSLDREGRKRIVAEQAPELGHAGTNIAKAMLSALQI